MRVSGFPEEETGIFLVEEDGILRDARRPESHDAPCLIGEERIDLSDLLLTQSEIREVW